MTVAFYMDEHVRGAITIGLRSRNIDVLTVQEDQRRATPDPILLDRATELGRLIVTQDDDFLREAQKPQPEGVEFSGVVYFPSQRSIIGDCVLGLEKLALVRTLEAWANLVVYLPL